jgi:2-polyprenyl-6-methoxyphenol hydroxylase-like FAD-dependent oxidoreductase
MDMWNDIHRHRTRSTDFVLLDRHGLPRARLPEVMMSGDVEILRGDLCRILYERTRSDTEYRFGDHIRSLEDRGDAVTVLFAGGRAEEFDLVIGADGLHSGVRALAFADESSYLRHQGYRLASFGLKNPLPDLFGAACFSEPGRGACLYGFSPQEARALLVYAAGPLAPGEREPESQRRALAERFAGMPWVVPQMLAALDDGADLYVDAIATVHIDRYASGRVGLLGDAAWGGTLGGQGTSLAIVGAYVLAHELAADSSPARAWARYEQEMRPYASRCQRGATHVGGFFAPRSRFGLALRNLMYGLFTSRPLSGLFVRLVKDAASDFALPEYGA